MGQRSGDLGLPWDRLGSSEWICPRDGASSLGASLVSVLTRCLCRVLCIFALSRGVNGIFLLLRAVFLVKAMLAGRRCEAEYADRDCSMPYSVRPDWVISFRGDAGGCRPCSMYVDRVCSVPYLVRPACDDQVLRSFEVPYTVPDGLCTIFSCQRLCTILTPTSQSMI